MYTHSDPMFLCIRKTPSHAVVIDCECEDSHLLKFPFHRRLKHTIVCARVQLSLNFQRLRKSRGAEKRGFFFFTLAHSLSLSVCSIPREKEIFRRNTTENKKGDIKEKRENFIEQKYRAVVEISFDI